MGAEANFGKTSLVVSRKLLGDLESRKKLFHNRNPTDQ
jgi:hypothetical protein